MGYRHRAVHLLIFRGDGDLLLQRRSHSKDTFPGAWDSSASGHLDAGEGYDAAVCREAGEELGIILAEAPERMFKLRPVEETGAEFVWVYRTSHEGPFSPLESEVIAIAWFSPEEIDRWIERKPSDFASAFVLIWRILRQQTRYAVIEE